MRETVREQAEREHEATCTCTCAEETAEWGVVHRCEACFAAVTAVVHARAAAQ